MSDEVERLSRVLDDLAAERDPRERAALSPDEAELAATASLLKGARPEHGLPGEDFVERLGARLSAARTGLDEAGAAPAATQRDVSRRRLLGRLAATAAGLVAGSGAGAAAAYNAAYDRGKQDGYTQQASEPYEMALAPDDRGEWLATGHTLTMVTPGQAVRFRAGAIEGFLVNPGTGGHIYALSAACTHMGCLISWLDSAGTFLCPCHGAQYNANGTVLSGVARHPLPRLRVRTDDKGQLYVWGVVERPTITTLAPYTNTQ